MYLLVYVFFFVCYEMYCFSLYDRWSTWLILICPFQSNFLLIVLKSLVENALINQEESWKWFSCNVHSLIYFSYFFSHLQFFVALIIMMSVYLYLCALSSGLQLLIQASSHDTLEIALWLVWKEEHTQFQLTSLKMLMRKWSIALLWTLLHQEHTSHNMNKRFSVSTHRSTVGGPFSEPYCWSDYYCFVSFTISCRYPLFQTVYYIL